MAIYPVTGAHPALAGLASPERFRFYELADGNGAYAAAALAEHLDCLELHLSVLRYGPHAVRSLRADLEELKRMAKNLGKTRIVGLRQESGPQADPRWAKFTRLFGFTNQQVYQAAELALD